MPSLSTYKKLMQKQGNTVGKIIKNDSIFTMENTWDNDLSIQTAYIYDYFHDDKPNEFHNITHEGTTKTKISVKFIVDSHESISSDHSSAKIQFKPSQQLHFDLNDELYYFQEHYHDRYNADFPIGMYIDLQDEKGVYNKWMIVQEDIQAPQFQKFFILPCTYQLAWIENDGGNRIKRKMWAVLRVQSSYNAGLWQNNVFLSTENQSLVWLPMNSITEQINYISPDHNNNQRFIVDIVCDNPAVWQLSKIQRTSPFGMCKLTLYKHEFDEHRDYIDWDNKEMYADYYINDIEPTESKDYDVMADESQNIETSADNIIGKLTTSTSTIRIGGSYKTITLNLYDGDIDVTDTFKASTITWACSIDGVDVGNDESLVKYLIQSEFNKIKLKFLGDKSYAGKTLEIKCDVDGRHIPTIPLELVI